MKTNKQKLIILLASLEFLACSYKKADSGPNLGPVSTELTVVQATEEQSESAGKTQISNLDLNKTYSVITETKAASQLIPQINALASEVLNPQNFMATSQNKTERFRLALSYFNFAIVKLAELSPNSDELDKVFSKYEAIALAGCNSSLQGCTNIGILRADQRSSKVLQLMASRLDNKMQNQCQNSCPDILKKYYSYLGLAFDTNNNTRNIDLEFLYMKRAQEYGMLFKSTNGEDREFFKKHGMVFNTIISNFPADSKNPAFVAFVKAFKPWNYSRLNENPFPFGIEKMFGFAAKNFLYETDGKTLNQELKKTILENQKIADKKGPSFSMAVEQLKKDPSSVGIFKSLNMDLSQVEKDSFYNEYFYMIDGLYRGRFGLEEVNSLWQGSKKDEKALLDAVNTYIRIEFIQRIVDTNRYMGSVFIQKNIPSDSLFRQVVQKSEPLTKDWGQMLAQMDGISVFLTQQLRNSRTASTSLSAAQLMIDGVKRNAKFLSVYPNMLMLGNFMIDVNAPLKFNTWWGAELSVDPTTIMTSLLDGSFDKPWFPFGGDSSPLNKTEIIYSYYYALNTGAFETFSVVKDAQGKPAIDRISFIRKGVHKTIQSSLETLDAAITGLRDSRDSNPAYATLKNICSNEEAGSKDYTVAMKLTDLQSFSLFGSTGKGLLKFAFESYQSSTTMSAFAGIRDAYEARLVQVRAMIDILGHNLKAITPAGAELEALQKELKLELESLEGAKKRFLSEMLTQHRLISSCLNRLQQLERDRQSELFAKEIEYLGKVWDAMTELQSQKLDVQAKKSKAAELAKKYGLQESESISGDGYNYTRLDMLNRFAMYSSSLKPKITLESPDDFEKNALTNRIETVQFIHPVTHQSVKRDEFINAGMSLFNPEGSNTLQWLQETANIDGWQNKLAAMTALYKLGFDAGGKQDPKFTVTADELINEAKEMIKFVGITDAERTWLNRMSRRERIPRDKLKGLLFEGSEAEMKGILDNTFDNVSSIRPVLDEATQYFISSKNVGLFLFPPPAEISRMMDKRYKSYAHRSERMVNDFEAAITRAEKSFDPANLNVTYRLGDNGKDTIYSTKLIDGGVSVLVTQRKLTELHALINNFHNVRTESFFKTQGKPE